MRHAANALTYDFQNQEQQHHGKLGLRLARLQKALEKIGSFVATDKAAVVLAGAAALRL
jgi:hypothetical protein